MATSPGTPRVPRAEGTGRTLPWHLWRERSQWHLDLGLPAPRAVTDPFLLFRLPSLWSFGTAAPGHSYAAQCHSAPVSQAPEPGPMAPGRVPPGSGRRSSRLLRGLRMQPVPINPRASPSSFKRSWTPQLIPGPAPREPTPATSVKSTGSFPNVVHGAGKGQEGGFPAEWELVRVSAPSH